MDSQVKVCQLLVGRLSKVKMQSQGCQAQVVWSDYHSFCMLKSRKSKGEQTELEERIILSYKH